MTYFHLRTARGNWLAAPGPGVEMSAAEDATRLIAAMPDANRQMCFLMAADLHPIEVQSDGMRGPAISALRLQTDGPGVLRLRHPLGVGRFLGVTRQGEGTAEGCVIFDSLGSSMLDAFLLVPATDIPETLRIAALELAEAAARPFRAAPLLAQLKAGVVRPELAETLLRLLPQDELSWLAARILAQREDLALLRRVMPADRWVNDILPALAAWNAGRSEPDTYLVSPPEDECASDPLEGQGQPQAGFVLTGLARAHVPPHRTACILAAARNEGPYLLEWIAYHRAIGIEHFFLYTNDNDDGSDILLQALARAGVITWIRNERGSHVGPQYKAYAHALMMLPHILDFRWTAILDMDEYIAFDTRMFARIADFLGWQETQRVDAIALCWLIFATDAAQPASSSPSVQRFTRREGGGVNPHVKSLFRTNLFWHGHAHFPYATMDAPFVFRTETGDIHHHPGVTDRIPAFARKPSADFAWINHYLLRTLPEALWKRARGLGDWTTPTPAQLAEFSDFVCRTFLRLAEGELVEDTRILDCAPGLRAELESLLDRPGVAAAQARIEAGFRPRLDALVQAFLGMDDAADTDEVTRMKAALRQHAGNAAPMGNTESALQPMPATPS